MSQGGKLLRHSYTAPVCDTCSWLWYVFLSMIGEFAQVLEVIWATNYFHKNFCDTSMQYLKTIKLKWNLYFSQQQYNT